MGLRAHDPNLRAPFELIAMMVHAHPRPQHWKFSDYSAASIWLYLLLHGCSHDTFFDFKMAAISCTSSGGSYGNFHVWTYLLQANIGEYDPTYSVLLYLVGMLNGYLFSHKAKSSLGGDPDIHISFYDRIHPVTLNLSSPASHWTSLAMSQLLSGITALSTSEF